MSTACAVLEEKDAMTPHSWLADTSDFQWENPYDKDLAYEWYIDATIPIVITTSSPQPDEAKFVEAMEAWKRETRFLSSSTEIALNPHYQDIIGMGKKVLPHIFRELERSGGRWFWALRHITHEDPVAPADKGKTKRMTEVWLQWGRKNHYL